MGRGKKQKVLFFHRINPINLAFAYLASSTCLVLYWQRDHVPKRLLARFKLVDPAEYFSWDDWKALGEEIYKNWKPFVESGHGRFHPREIVQKREVDLTGCWLQWLAKSFEQECYFRHLVARWQYQDPDQRRASAAGTCLELWQGVVAPELPCGNRVESLRWLSWLDLIWQRIFAFLFELKLLKSLLFARTADGARLMRSTRYLWSGISASEIATGPRKLDVAFISERGFAPFEDSLFLVDRAPSAEASTWYSSHGARWAGVSDFGAFLTVRERLSVAIHVASLSVKTLFSVRPRRSPDIVKHMIARAVPWVWIGNKLKPELYLSSVSASWPESPAVAAMNACGVRTVVWHYSANVFGFVEQVPGFQDLNVALSISVSKEVWVWNRVVEELLTARSLPYQGGHLVEFRLVGPVMCGDSRWLSRSPHEARELLGLRVESGDFIVAIFDVPPVTNERRIEIGMGPTPYTVELLNRFFEDVCEILDRIGKVRVLIKPKRALNDPQREYAPAMWRILNKDSAFRRSGRVIVIDHDVDPYLPVAMADVSIGLPFTSPVLAALGSGRGGLFHDPLGTTRQFRPIEFGRWMTHGRDELLSRLIEWTSGNKGPTDVGTSELSAVSGPKMDAGAAFYGAMKGRVE